MADDFATAPLLWAMHLLSICSFNTCCCFVVFVVSLFVCSCLLFCYVVVVLFSLFLVCWWVLVRIFVCCFAFVLGFLWGYFFGGRFCSCFGLGFFGVFKKMFIVATVFEVGGVIDRFRVLFALYLLF